VGSYPGSRKNITPTPNNPFVEKIFRGFVTLPERSFRYIKWRGIDEVVLPQVTALTVNAEHMEANQLPCNVAVRLQALGWRCRDSRKQGRKWFVVKVIEFYIPSNFRKNAKPTPVEQLGKVIEFDSWKKKSA
jgi:hypothetical protein